MKYFVYVEEKSRDTNLSYVTSPLLATTFSSNYLANFDTKESAIHFMNTRPLIGRDITYRLIEGTELVVDVVTKIEVKEKVVEERVETTSYGVKGE